MKLNMKTTKVLFGTAALLASFSSAQAQTQGVPQTNPNGNAPVSGPCDGNLWSLDAVNQFDTDALVAQLREGSGGNDKASVDWYFAFSNLLSSIHIEGAKMTLMYKIADSTLTLTEALRSQVTNEVAMSIPGYQIALNRAYEPVVFIYHHAYESIKNLGDIDVEYNKALKKLSDKDSSPIEVKSKLLDDRLRAYTIDQINWFEKNFLIQNQNETNARYSPAVYYSVLSSILKSSVNTLTGGTLDPNIFITSTAKSVSKMRALINIIDSFRAGNILYGNENYTFFFVQRQTQEIKNSLTRGE